MITLLLELVLKIASWLLPAPPSPAPVHGPRGGSEISRVLPLPSLYLIYFLIIHVTSYLVKNVLEGLLVCAKLTEGAGSALTIAFGAGEGFGGRINQGGHGVTNTAWVTPYLR